MDRHLSRSEDVYRLYNKNWLKACVIQLIEVIERILKVNIIQLMHSVEVNIRICQPENSDVH